MPNKKATIKRSPSRKAVQASVKMQAPETPKKAIKFKQLSSEAMYHGGNVDAPKISILDLEGVSFKITSMRLISNANGESYVANIITSDDEMYHFWAKPDETRDAIYRMYKDAVRDGADEIGWFTVEVLEPKHSGMNGYARIVIKEYRKTPRSKIR